MNKMVAAARSVLGKIPVEVRYAILLFVVTRLALVIVGVSSRIVLEPYHGKEYHWKSPKPLWLDIWEVWDSGWYLGIAQRGYSGEPSQSPLAKAQTDLVFFPLYPMLIRAVGVLVRDDFIAGILISNVCLLVAGILLYRLTLFDDDRETALRSIRYLFLFPTAFVLSGIFTEALFTVLAIACFYHARKRRWLLVGIIGFFLSLTKHVGVLVLLPLLYEYLKNAGFRLKAIRSDVLFLALIPLGTALYGLYNFHLTGDFLAFARGQKAWGRHQANPLVLLYQNLGSAYIHQRFIAWYALACLGALVAFCRRLGVSYTLLGLLILLIPLSSSVDSLPRISVLVFPFHILFARLGKNPTVDQALTICLAILQSFLMVLWANGFSIMM